VLDQGEVPAGFRTPDHEAHAHRFKVRELAVPGADDAWSRGAIEVGGRQLKGLGVLQLRDLCRSHTTSPGFVAVVADVDSVNSSVYLTADMLRAIATLVKSSVNRYVH
jgi:hypothetical protein